MKKYDEIMNVEMSYDQISKLAYQTCQWWNSVFVQAKRFINASENNDEMPWDDSNATFIADRLFLIMAIYHSFEGIKKLNIELQRENDFSLDPVVKSLDNIVNFETIKQLRNMNEHGLDYLIGKGRAKNYYETTVETATRKIHTNAGMTIVWGDEDLFLFGKVPIDKLLLAMKDQFPLVKNKLEEIFIHTWFRKKT